MYRLHPQSRNKRGSAPPWSIKHIRANITLFALGCVCTTSCREIIEEINTRKKIFFGRKKFWAEKLVWKLVQDPIFGDAQSSIHNPAEVATKCAGFYQNLQYLQYSKLKIYTHKQALELEPFFAYRYGPNLTKKSIFRKFVKTEKWNYSQILPEKLCVALFWENNKKRFSFHRRSQTERSLLCQLCNKRGNCFPDLRPVQSSVFLSFLWLNQFLWLLQNPIVFWAKLLGRCLDCGDHPPTLIQPQSSKLSDIMLDLHKVSYNLTC